MQVVLWLQENPGEDALVLDEGVRTAIQLEELVDLRAALRASFAWDHPNGLAFVETCRAFSTRHLITRQC